MARRFVGILAILFCLLDTLGQPAMAESGPASWYSLTTRTASGENCNPNALTAAHRSLPFGTKVRVENLKNGKWVVVRINDRGPFTRGRILDVTRATAERLGFLEAGLTNVRLTILARAKK